MPLPLDLRELRLRHGRATAEIGPVDLRIQHGERAGLAGRSGSGKTSILDWMAGVGPPGLHSSHPRDGLTRMVYLAQDASDCLSPYLTATEQVAAFGSGAAVWLSRLGLTDARRQNAYPCQLSGGERKRVQVAQALASGADLILADEPTAHLDAETAETVLQALDESSAALLVASHHERVFTRLRCSHVARLTPASPTPAGPPLADPGPVLVELRDLDYAHTSRDFWRQSRRTGFALRNIELRIHQGEMVTLSGPSGSGKTTLARCLSRMGQCAVQLVEQEPSATLNPRQSVADAVREADPHADVSGVLEQVGLAQAVGRCAELSEGERARLAIARALAALPQGGLLILDESLAGLDDETCEQVLHTVIAAQRRTGLACLLISHDADLPAHRRLVMREGRLT